MSPLHSWLSCTWFAPSAPTSVSSSRSSCWWLRLGYLQAHISRRRWETWFWQRNYKRYVPIILLFQIGFVLIYVPTGGWCVQLRTVYSDLAYFHCADTRCGRFPYHATSGRPKYGRSWEESESSETWGWGLVLASRFLDCIYLLLKIPVNFQYWTFSSLQR